MEKPIKSVLELVDEVNKEFDKLIQENQALKERFGTCDIEEIIQSDSILKNSLHKLNTTYPELINEIDKLIRAQLVESSTCNIDEITGELEKIREARASKVTDNIYKEMDKLNKEWEEMISGNPDFTEVRVELLKQLMNKHGGTFRNEEYDPTLIKANQSRLAEQAKEKNVMQSILDIIGENLPFTDTEMKDSFVKIINDYRSKLSKIKVIAKYTKGYEHDAFSEGTADIDSITKDNK